MVPDIILSAKGNGKNADEAFAAPVKAVLQNWVLLLKVNALFILFSLPLVTIPAAYCSSISILSDVIRNNYDEPFMLTRFLSDIRRTFVISVLGSMAFVLLEFICIGAVIFYAALAEEALYYSILCAIAVFVSIGILLIAMYFFSALSMRAGITVRQLLVVSFYGVMLRPGSAILGGAMVLLFWICHLVTYPFSVFFPVLFSFSIGTLILAFATGNGVNLAFDLIDGKKAE